MSTEVTVAGQILIYPPIEHLDLSTVPDLTTQEIGLGESRDAWIKTEVQRAETPQGTLSVARGVAIVASDDEFSHSRMEGDINEIVQAFPDRTYTGYLECSSPDDGGSRWRVMVRDGRAVGVHPKLVWPDIDAEEEATP